MIATTFDSESVFLLPYRPNAASEASADFELLTRANRALAGQSGRVAQRYTLLTRYRFACLLRSGDVGEFNHALTQLENKRVLCPFWPAAQLYSSGATPPASTGIWLTFEPGTATREVHTASAPSGFTPSVAALRVPLMLGIFEQEPDPVPATPTVSTVAIRFIETGPATYAMRPPSATFTDGPALTGRTPKLFPLAANWALSRSFGRASVEIEREAGGYGRTPAESYTPQTPERLLELGVHTFTPEKAARLLAFFHERQGNVEGFWVEGLSDHAKLTANTSGASAVISVDYPARFVETPFLALIVAGGATLYRKVISIDEGAGTITLDATPGTLTAASVRIVALLLARFVSPKLTFSFVSGSIARVEISVRELATEYATPAGETYGVTFGALARVARLYRFRLKYAGGDVVERYTSYEREVDVAGEIFTPMPGLNHKSIADSLDIEKSAVGISARIKTGTVLAKLSPFQLEVPLWVEILECTPDASGAAGSATAPFVGRVRKPRRKGPFLTFEVVHLLAELQEEVPAMLIQPGDNYELYGAANGLDEADWTFTANVVSVSATGSSITINTLARTAGVPTITAGYFGYGRVWRGSGSSLQSRTIVNSTALSSGSLTIHLNQPFDGTPTGSLSLSPGYSGEIDEAESKFANRARFGGFPFVPVGNPALVPITQETQQGKK